jgi:hypothetical protein
MTGRERGTDGLTTKASKGIAGDWQNNFTRTDGAMFDAKAGDVLVDLGQAVDRSWYEHLTNTLSFG